MLRRSWSHLWKKDDVSYAFGSSEHHDKSVNADADPSRWRHSVFESREEIFVEFLGFTSALVLESFALEVGVIEFRVTGRDFLAVDDEFVDVDNAGVGGIELSERDEFFRAMRHKEGVHGFFFYQFFEDMLGEFEILVAVGDIDFMFRAPFAALLGGEFVPVWRDSANQIRVRSPPPRAREVDRFNDVAFCIVMFDEQGPADFFRDMADHFLD